MKRGWIPAGILLAIAGVIVTGSLSFLSPCVHEDGSFGACHWAGRMLTGLGCALGVLAALSLIFRGLRLFMDVSAVPVCILGILTPGTLIDLCRMSTMRCRMIMQPAMILLFSAALICAAADAIVCGRKRRK